MKRDMTAGSVFISLLCFVIPLTIGNILQQLYNIIDTYIVGKYLGSLALSAVGSVSSLIFVFNAVIMGLKAGIAITCSESFGRRDSRDFACFGRAGLILVLASTIICVSVGVLGLRGLLSLISVPNNVFDMAESYIRIIVCGLPAVFAFNYGIAIAQARGNSVITFIALLVSTATNVLLDIVFICRLGLGVNGAAYATVIAQIMSVGIVFCFIIYKGDYRHNSKIRIRLVYFKEIVRVALPSILQQGILSIGIVSITGLINRCGTSMIAGVAIGGKIDSVMTTPVITIAEALSVFVAQNIGAGKPERIRKGLICSLAQGYFLALVLVVLIITKGKNLIQLFLSEANPAIVQEGMNYMVSILVMLLFMIPFRSYIGIFVGMKKMQWVIVAFFLNIVSRVTVAYSLFPFIKKYAVYIANPFSVLVGAVVSITLYYYPDFKVKQQNRVNVYEKSIDCQCSASGD